MKNILIHCAMEKEAKQVANKLDLIENKNKEYIGIQKAYLGELENKKVSLIVTGIGKQKSAIGLTEYLAKEEKPDLIINIGFAGSTLSKIGTWVCINKSYNFDWKIEDEEKYSMKDLGNQDLIMVNSIPNLPCYSAESFVTNSDIAENVIFDMELHSVNIIADMYKIPLMSLKKVTDNLSLEDYYENIENIIELESCVKYIKEAIASN